MTQSCRIQPGPGQIDPAVVGVPMLEIHNALGVSWEVVDPDYYRKVLLKIYWDDQETPSVIAPLGDFFGCELALGVLRLAAAVGLGQGERAAQFGGSAAFNCYFRMPFGNRARIVVENQNDIPYLQYFYIDYELSREPLPDDTAYFHAHWRRALPNAGLGSRSRPTASRRTSPTSTAPTTTSSSRPRAGGTTSAAISRSPLPGIVVGRGRRHDLHRRRHLAAEHARHRDGGLLRPRLGHAAQRVPVQRLDVHEEDVPGFHHSYRFHLVDPIRFEKRIRVTMEHGHGNHLSDDWSSTAYWYQTLPSPRLTVPRRRAAPASSPGRSRDRGGSARVDARAAERPPAGGRADGALRGRA